MSKVIFLNGCSSSGKTHIAQSIQHLSSEPWLRLGLDMMIDMMPDQYIAFGDKAKEGYFTFVPGTNERGSTIRIEDGLKGEQVFGLMPRIAKVLLEQNNNLIIDEVLLDDVLLKTYLQELNKQTVYFVGVRCDLATMQEREILRGDRAIGLANDQVDRVHNGLRDYDVVINTTSTSPFENAGKILKFIEQTPVPKGFMKMYESLS